MKRIANELITTAEAFGIMLIATGFAYTLHLIIE